MSNPDNTPKEIPDDYIPFGEEWEKEMKRHPKDFLIGRIKKSNQIRQSQEAEIEKYKSAHEINYNQMMEIAAIAEDRLKEIERLKGLVKEAFEQEPLYMNWTDFAKLNNL